MITLLNNKSIIDNTYFGSHRKFKKMFKVCSYSGQSFENGDTKTLEHIIPKSRGGKDELANFIVVKRRINSSRSSMTLSEFMDKNPEVLVNILRTLDEFKGKIIEGINWAEEVKKNLYKETQKDIFK